MLTQTIESEKERSETKRTEREERYNFGKRKDRAVQHLAVLKRFKRVALSDEKRTEAAGNIYSSMA